jgi:hypothetical protein
VIHGVLVEFKQVCNALCHAREGRVNADFDDACAVRRLRIFGRSKVSEVFDDADVDEDRDEGGVAGKHLSCHVLRIGR